MRLSTRSIADKSGRTPRSTNRTAPNAAISIPSMAMLAQTNNWVSTCFPPVLCGEHDGLSALQDHVNELWAQEGEVNKAPDVAPGDAVALGQILQRSGAAGRQLL